MGELLEGHSHRFCLFFLSLSLLLSFLLSCASTTPFCPFFSLFRTSFLLFFFFSSHSLSFLTRPPPLGGRFDPTTRIELEFTMLFRHRVPTRRRTRLDTTRRRIDDTAPSFLAALNDSASSEIPLRTGRTWNLGLTRSENRETCRQIVADAKRRIFPTD